MHVNGITDGIIGAAITIHRAFGPGLLESSYKLCMIEELADRGFEIECEKPLPISYKGIHIPAAYKADLIINAAVIVELKCVERFLPVHEAQVLTYMRLTNIQTGLLINFKVKQLIHGIRRFTLAALPEKQN